MVFYPGQNWAMANFDPAASRVGIYLRHPASCPVGKPGIKCDTLFDTHLPFASISTAIAVVPGRRMVRRSDIFDTILLSVPATGSSLALLNLDLRWLGFSDMAEPCRS